MSDNPRSPLPEQKSSSSSFIGEQLKGQQQVQRLEQIASELKATPHEGGLNHTRTEGQMRDKPDEFAPHWSALLSKDGTLAVTFEIETTLIDIPDVGLVDLLRAGILAQRSKSVPLKIIVNGQEHRATYPLKATIRTIIADVTVTTRNISREVVDWEMRDAEGAYISPDLTLGAALANFPNHKPLWLTLRAGWGA